MIPREKLLEQIETKEQCKDNRNKDKVQELVWFYFIDFISLKGKIVNTIYNCIPTQPDGDEAFEFLNS